MNTSMNYRSILSTALLVVLAGTAAACSEGEVSSGKDGGGPDGTAGQGGGGSGGSGGGGSGGSGGGGSGGGGSGGGGSGGGGSGGGGSGGSGGLDTSALGDMPYFTTPMELCGYVNESRMHSASHEAYGGDPPAYHADRSWPITFTFDDGLMKAAQEEADRLGGGGGPKGALHGDGLRYRKIWVDGANTAAYQVTAKDEPGDWNVSYFKSGLINAHAGARQWLYYQDPGKDGPRLTKMGCGGANAGGGAVWWVIKLGP